MNTFQGYSHGIGLGGWLTNYKRLALIPPDKRYVLSPGDLEHFESYITRDDVKRIASFGVDHIRLGFDQVVFESYERPGEIRKRSFELLDRFVSWCDSEHIKLVLNLHKAIGNYCDFSDGRSLLDDPDMQARVCRLWAAFEAHYHEESMAFELLNEVRQDPDGRWSEFANAMIRTIRASNPERDIIVGSAWWNSPDHLKDLKILDDPHVALTFHFYDPFEFTHQRGVLQGAVAAYNRELPYPGDIEPYREFRRFAGEDPSIYDGFDRMDLRYLRHRLQSVADFAAAHPDTPLYCGEFGTIRHCRIEYRVNWFADVIAFLKEYGIPYCVWNYLSTPYDGNKFSLVDDDRREIISPRLLDFLRG